VASDEHSHPAASIRKRCCRGGSHTCTQQLASVRMSPEARAFPQRLPGHRPLAGGGGTAAGAPLLLKLGACATIWVIDQRTATLGLLNGLRGAGIC
jgi:hypothetical protein